ncbi:hypothetical protein V8G54_024433, partial [Vigna mungo]
INHAFHFTLILTNSLSISLTHLTFATATHRAASHLATAHHFCHTSPSLQLGLYSLVFHLQPLLLISVLDIGAGYQLVFRARFGLHHDPDKCYCIDLCCHQFPCVCFVL